MNKIPAQHNHKINILGNMYLEIRIWTNELYTLTEQSNHVYFSKNQAPTN